MSYEQHMKHFKNHRKNHFYQQCGFSMNGTAIKSLATIAEETAEKYIVKDMETGDVLSREFYDSNDAVDFVRNLDPDVWAGIYTDKGFCIMK